MTIINQYPVVESGPIWIVLIFAVCCIICGLNMIFALSNQRYTMAIAFGVLCVFFFTSTLWVACGEKTDKNYYECLIDDTTPFVEVAENYDVVGRRGDLWILEDKIDE